jgi:hypothetical protein
MHTFSRFARPYQRLCAAFSTVPVGNQIADSARPGFWLGSRRDAYRFSGSGRARPLTPGGRVGVRAACLVIPARRPSLCVILVRRRTLAGLGCRGHCQHAVSAGRGMWLPGCSSAGVITGTGKRLGSDHIGVPRAGRKGLMPGALASDPRPVDTDPLRCFHLLGQPPISGAPASTPGSWPWSRRAGCQASPDPRASVRPIATSAHPARRLTERRPRRRGTWGPCRRADLRSSLSRWPASSSIMYGCIVFTY